MKEIATVLRSSSHLEYTAQVINPRKFMDIKPLDYALGNFVLLGEQTIGIIYDTELFNPNSLTLNSQKEDQQIFAPDLLDEVDILLKILLLGSIHKTYGDQNLPTETLETGLKIYNLPADKLKTFHQNQAAELQMKYLVNLGELSPGLFKCIADQLQKVLSESQFKIVQLIERDLWWNQLLNQSGRKTMS